MFLTNNNLSLRAQNLLWTVSGNHSLKVKLDYNDASFVNKCLYEALVLGTCEKHFCIDEIMLYSLKKEFLGADKKLLGEIVSLCLDIAIFERAYKERFGSLELQNRAYNELLDLKFEHLISTKIGKLELARYLSVLGRSMHLSKLEQIQFEKLNELNNKNDAEIIATIDSVYNEYLDEDFKSKNISLNQVLSVSIQEMIEEGFLKNLNKNEYINDVLQNAAENENVDNANDLSGISTASIKLENNSDAKMVEYTEQAFGKNALTQAEQQSLYNAVCNGLHSGRRVLVTEGLLQGEVGKNIHFKLAEKHRHHNEMSYYSEHRIVKQNIHNLGEILKRSLIKINDVELEPSSKGSLKLPELWRIGRANTSRMFIQRHESGSKSFVVDVLVDGSGSQSRRQGLVATQAYILSGALSLAKIPHRVSSYCTAFDCTVLHRFRDFDDPDELDTRVFDYSAKASNRDGLAIRTSLHSLLKRQEQNKILIILSDGKPNDVAVKNSNSQMTVAYVLDTAIIDTAKEVRRARNLGASVLGVFAGLEDDIEAERKIFGKDFAYIRKLNGFSQIVGRYLQQCIDDSIQ